MIKGKISVSKVFPKQSITVTDMHLVPIKNVSSNPNTSYYNFGPAQNSKPNQEIAALASWLASHNYYPDTPIAIPDLESFIDDVYIPADLQSSNIGSLADMLAPNESIWVEDGRSKLLEGFLISITQVEFGLCDWSSDNICTGFLTDNGSTYSIASEIPIPASIFLLTPCLLILLRVRQKEVKI